MLDDPQMKVSEDLYFYLLLASKTKFACNFGVSAVWNWRTTSKDNSMTGVPPSEWEQAGEILKRRLGRLEYVGARRIDLTHHPRIIAPPRPDRGTIPVGA